MSTFLILVLDGVMDSSLAVTLDTLRTAQALLAARDDAPPVRVRTVTVKAHATTACGLRLAGDQTLKTAAPETADWIIVPGLGAQSEQQIRQRLAARDAVQAARWLAGAGSGKAHMAASCSAVFLMAQAGLLHGRAATTTWWLAPAFRARHPDVRLDETRMVVRDGARLTAGAALSQMDLMLSIVSEAMGPSVAHGCARYLLIDQRPSQARYMMQTHVQHQDSHVVAAERWIDAHIGEAMTVDALARALAIPAKTLARRIEAATGLSPIKFIQRRRLSRAAHLIETTRLSIEEIATQVGYRDSTALRKLIKREFGMTPGALR